MIIAAKRSHEDPSCDHGDRYRAAMQRRVTKARFAVFVFVLTVAHVCAYRRNYFQIPYRTIIATRDVSRTLRPYRGPAKAPSSCIRVPMSNFAGIPSNFTDIPSCDIARFSSPRLDRSIIRVRYSRTVQLARGDGKSRCVFRYVLQEIVQIVISHFAC